MAWVSPTAPSSSSQQRVTSRRTTWLPPHMNIGASRSRSSSTNSNSNRRNHGVWQPLGMSSFDYDKYGDPLSDDNDNEGGASSGLATSLERVADMGLNEMQTLLRQAVRLQDFDAATTLRDALAERVSSGAYTTGEEDARKRTRLSWKGLGTAPWLIERLDALGYTYPTTIQINAIESVNTILGSFQDEEDDDITLEERMQLSASKDSMGVVISGSTGSGKTLAYLVPLLSTLSETLFVRQKIRVQAEEDVGDKIENVLERIMVTTSPTLRRPGNTQVGGGSGRTGSAITTGAALSTLGKSGTDVKSPVALIVVPTRELGVQTALLLFELVGGSTKRTAQESSGMKNMFKYKGPKGIKIGCVLDESEASHGLKLQTDVAITTPKFLEKLMRDGDVDPSKLRVVAFDEADLALEQTPETALATLFNENTNSTSEERQFSRLTYLVGATVTERLGSLAVRDSVLPEGKSFISTATRFAPIESYTHLKAMEDQDQEQESKKETPRAASLKDLGLCLDPGLRHERVVAANNTGLLCLTRLLRKELRLYDEAIIAGSDVNNVQRPRVVIFFPNEKEAKGSIVALRDAMWQQHKLCVLLPDTGENPLMIMEQFKNNETSVMLATSNSVRGLDFPELTHVYTLYLPADDPREYLHLAGRVGRIGQRGSITGGGGRVISILRPEEAEQMTDLAQTLNFSFVDTEAPKAELYSMDDSDSDAPMDVEDARRNLEDMMTLLNLAENPTDNTDQVIETSNLEVDDYDDDDDDDDDVDDDVIDAEIV
eukprot:CAMPEP_0198286092 /NCGR_PEP_ID=MMETSP1449-20131203/5246_1 /TAXON_ID=420275 /ORGANISM="Attheya septentrionalis, Strain CCMP2084" /LENGTH=773 /DNA_ID=CAMNT_0043983723 /DNA_START=295 /DNA_END=2619 /DNA_ORIENTATION=-